MNGNTENNVFEQYAELVRRVKAGDESAFTEIYEKSQKLVYTTCLGILNNEQDAEDAMQETYITVYDKISTLEDEKTFVHWLKTVAANKARDKFKFKKDNLSYEDAVATEEDLMGDDNLENLPDSLVLEKDKRDTLHKIMRNELSDAQYQTLLLYYYDELKISEIANVMECPEETIKSRLKASRIKLKAGIEAYEKKNGVSLMAGLAGAQTLGNFFRSYYGSARFPSFKPFPLKIAAGSASKVAAKAGAKAGSKAVAKTAGGVSAAKIGGIALASVLGLGLIGGAVFTIKKLNDANQIKDDGKVYELNYKGLYCNIDEDENVNDCYRFYSNGDVIHAFYEFNEDDECFPVGDWFNMGSDDGRVETGTFEADEGKLEVTLEHKSKDVEYSGTIGKKSIVLDDVEYEFYKFSDIPGYITEYQNNGTSNPTDPSGSAPVDDEPYVSVTDAVNETYEFSAWNIQHTYSYRYPQINIKGKNMDAVNAKIAQDIEAYHQSTFDQDLASYTRYIYYIDDEIVSVCIQVDTGLGAFKDIVDSPIIYFCYNVLISTGEFVEPSELVNMRGMSDDEFFDLVNMFCVDLEYITDYLMSDSEAFNSPDITYDNVIPFVSPEGHTCFAVKTVMQGIPYGSLADTNTLRYNYYFDYIKGSINSYSSQYELLLALGDTFFANGLDFDSLCNAYIENHLVDDQTVHVVSVTDDINTLHYFSDSDEPPLKYRVPKVEISGLDMTAVNRKIEMDIDKCSPVFDLGHPKGADYIYYIDDKVVSICVRVVFDEMNESADMYLGRREFVYNISVETGKLLGPSDFLKLYGITDEEFFDSVKLVYQDYYDLISTQLDSENAKLSLEKNLMLTSFEHVTPFMSPENKMCISAPMYFYYNDNHDSYHIYGLFYLESETLRAGYWDPFPY